MTHEELVKEALSWARRNYFIAEPNLRSRAVKERPDIYGFKECCSIVIEVKVSRADFFADHKKPHRNDESLGNWKYYYTPPGLVQPHEVPSGWGLIQGRKIIHGAPKNNDWCTFPHETNLQHEIAMMKTLARRIKK